MKVVISGILLSATPLKEFARHKNKQYVKDSPYWPMSVLEISRNSCVQQLCVFLLIFF